MGASADEPCSREWRGPDPATVTFRRLIGSVLEVVKHLRVRDEQLPFVGRIETIVEHAPPSSHFHAIAIDGDIVGFFNIDTAYGATYAFSSPGEVGLRAFFIEARHQGKGYGTAAARALAGYVAEHYPDAPSIALTVNCRNRAAHRTYLGAGFADTGELYHGGRAGPQHVMRMTLRDR